MTSERKSLFILPNELLLLIASHLNNNIDCIHFASCCRRLHSLLLLQAYSTIELGRQSPRPLSLLARSVIQNPKLGHAIRVLSLGGDPEDLSRRSSDHPAVVYDPEIIEPVLEEVCQNKVQRQEMEEGLKKGDEDDAWLVLMSPFLLNIEKLHLNFPAYPFPISRMLDISPGKFKSVDAISPFSSLTEVSITATDDDEDGLVSAVWHLFGLSSLRKFTGYGILESDEDKDFMAWTDVKDKASGFSAVTHIEFRTSYSEYGFPYLVRACAELKSFIYENCADDFDRRLYSADFYPGLCAHRGTLEELTLISLPDYFDRDEAEDLWFGSMADFIVLKRVRMRAANLLGPDDVPLVGHLPPSLESLCITDAADVSQRVLAKHLKSLVSVAATQYPHLAQIRIENPLDEGTRDDWALESMFRGYAALARLKRVCRAAGIDFCIANWDHKANCWRERYRTSDS